MLGLRSPIARPASALTPSPQIPRHVITFRSFNQAARHSSPTGRFSQLIPYNKDTATASSCRVRQPRIPSATPPVMAPRPRLKLPCLSPSAPTAALPPSLARPLSSCSASLQSATTAFHGRRIPPPTPQRWVSDLRARVGKCITFGCDKGQIARAAGIVRALAEDWRPLTAGSEGFLSGGRRGLEGQKVVWGEQDSFVGFSLLLIRAHHEEGSRRPCRWRETLCPEWHSESRESSGSVRFPRD